MKQAYQKPEIQIVRLAEPLMQTLNGTSVGLVDRGAGGDEGANSRGFDWEEDDY